jgi:hypothetical protein
VLLNGDVLLVGGGGGATYSPVAELRHETAP